MKILVDSKVHFEFRLKNAPPEAQLTEDEKIRKNWAGLLELDPDMVSRRLMGSDFSMIGDAPSSFDFLYTMLLKLNDCNEYEKCALQLIQREECEPFMDFICSKPKNNRVIQSFIKVSVDLKMYDLAASLVTRFKNTKI
jgi:hypothetical protein